MSTLVKFPDVAFEEVSYGTVESNRTSIQKAPTAATLTAKIIGGNGWVTLVMSAEKFFWEPGKPTEPPPGLHQPPGTGGVMVGIPTATSNGVEPLPVNVGESVFVLLTLNVPTQHLTPGPVDFTLQIESDNWTVPPIPMTVTVIAR